jgi:hypothetical protein
MKIRFFPLLYLFSLFYFSSLFLLSPPRPVIFLLFYFCSDASIAANRLRDSLTWFNLNSAASFGVASAESPTSAHLKFSPPFQEVFSKSGIESTRKIQKTIRRGKNNLQDEAKQRERPDLQQPRRDLQILLNFRTKKPAEGLFFASPATGRGDAAVSSSAACFLDTGALALALVKRESKICDKSFNGFFSQTSHNKTFKSADAAA